MDILIRVAVPEDAASIARVHVDSWRSTYPGIVPAEYLDGLSYRSRESHWKGLLTTDRPEMSYFVAETQGGDIVGFANAGPEREGNRVYQGELYAIYILEEYQRMGLGRRLFSSVTRRLLSDDSTRCSCGCWRTIVPPSGSTNRWEVSESVDR